MTCCCCQTKLQLLMSFLQMCLDWKEKNTLSIPPHETGLFLCSWISNCKSTVGWITQQGSSIRHCAAKAEKIPGCIWWSFLQNPKGWDKGKHVDVTNVWQVYPAHQRPLKLEADREVELHKYMEPGNQNLMWRQILHPNMCLLSSLQLPVCVWFVRLQWGTAQWEQCRCSNYDNRTLSTFTAPPAEQR